MKDPREVLPNKATVHTLARLLAGHSLNGTAPDKLSPLWRKLTLDLAQLAYTERLAHFKLDMDQRCVTPAEQAIVLDVCFRENTEADAPEDPAFWFTPIDMEETMEKHFLTLNYAVPGVFHEGLWVFFAPAKAGKSLLLLHLSLAIASGGKAFESIPTPPGEVLYFSLEDPERRIQDRGRKMLRGESPPPGLHFSYVGRPVNEGLIEALEMWMREHPQTKMIVIDTLAGIRPAKGKDDQQLMYHQEYQMLLPLAQFAQRHRVLVLGVTHTRKMGTEDWTQAVNGSTGILAVADGVARLERSRDAFDAQLRLSGKDLDGEVTMKFSYDPITSIYRLVTDHEEVNRSEPRNAVLAKLRENPTSPPTIAELADRLGKPHDAIKKLVTRMRADRDILVRGKNPAKIYLPDLDEMDDIPGNDEEEAS